MNSLDERILDVLTKQPGQKARDLAALLGVDRSLVNSVLYGPLKGKVRQDSNYRWYPKVAGEREQSKSDQSQRLDTHLAKLSAYYLDCLNYDDVGGVSVFADSKFGDLDYVELTTLPMFDVNRADPFISDAGRRMLARTRRDRNRQMIYLGYPVRLHLIRSRKGWEGFKVEPLLLFPFEEPQSRSGTPTLTEDSPQVNFSALRTLTREGEAGLMQEANELSKELGLGKTGEDQPDLDELLARLYEIRAEWDWREKPNPAELSKGQPLSSLTLPGIYNRAILVASERSPYTKGLESELVALQGVTEQTYAGTALGTWINEKLIDAPAPGEEPLLEVLPLNSEQRQAVRQALANPLTVITGPPGTGKSQVVTSILVNAAWRGMKVLFASKNNKAVDVVETRVNALGPRPILSRLGANQYQSRLSEYLISLLSATATPDDHRQYNECKAIHVKLQKRAEVLDAELQALLALHN